MCCRAEAVACGGKWLCRCRLVLGGALLEKVGLVVLLLFSA